MNRAIGPMWSRPAEQIYQPHFVFLYLPVPLQRFLLISSSLILFLHKGVTCNNHLAYQPHLCVEGNRSILRSLTFVPREDWHPHRQRLEVSIKPRSLDLHFRSLHLRKDIWILKSVQSKFTILILIPHRETEADCWPQHHYSLRLNLKILFYFLQVVNLRGFD